MDSDGNEEYLAAWKTQLYPPKIVATVMATELKERIISFLPQDAIARMAQCCTAWHKVSIRALYTNNVAEGESSAILWAARSAHKGDKRATEIALKILKRCREYGGEVNTIHKDYPSQRGDETRYESAAPIHYAIANGNERVVRRLLHMGAKVDIPCSGKSWAKHVLNPSVLMRRLDDFSGFYPGHYGSALWLPLFLALLTFDPKTAQLLFANGATRDAMHLVNNADVSQRISILHFVAADKHKASFENWKFVFDMFSKHINEPCAAGQHTPLHAALMSSNLRGMESILQAGAKLDALNESSRTPLVMGIKKLPLLGPGGLLRRRHIACLKRLVGHGATVNPENDSVLVPAIRYYQFLPFSAPDVRSLIDFFLAHGADVNAPDAFGTVPVAEIIDAIFSMKAHAGATRVLRKLLIDLVNKGMKLESHNTHSPLYLVMQNEDAQPGWLFDLLWRKGATIQPWETDAFFLKWCQIPRLHAKYNVLRYKKDISMGAMQHAYQLSFKLETSSLYKLLERQSLPAPSANHMV